MDLELNIFYSKGIKAPFWFVDTMINTIGERQSEKSLQIGKIYKPKEALKIHLIDELASSENLLHLAEEQMKNWIKIPSNLNFFLI